MSNNGKQYDQDENFEQRLYQTLAIIERAGEQQRSAAATVERLDGLGQRINQIIQTAATEASARIPSEARSTLDGAFTESAAALNQAARSAVVAAENLRWPWWQYLFVVLAAGLLSAIGTAWMMSGSNETVYQTSREDQRLIDEGRMLEQVWPRLSRAEQKRIEPLTAQP